MSLVSLYLAGISAGYASLLGPSEKDVAPVEACFLLALLVPGVALILVRVLS